MAKDKTKKNALPGGEVGGKVKAAKLPKLLKRRKNSSPDAPLMPGETGQKKKKSKVKTPKAARKRKNNKLIVYLIIAVVLLLIIAAAVFTMMYNPYDARDKMFDFVYSLDPRENVRDKVLDDRSAALDEREEGIALEEGELELRSSELDVREETIAAEEERLEQLREQLSERKTELDLREEEMIPRYLQPMTDEQLADMQRLAKIYAAMSAEEAAEIMSSLYIVDDIVAILYQMKDSVIAEILTAMEVGLAVEITDILLHQ